MRRNGQWLLPTIGAFATASILVGAEAHDIQTLETSPPPPLSLANVYSESATDLQLYWVSEKYDGVRAYWNGTRLLTRAGNEIRAPHWFVASLPAVALDGELWIGRGRFEQLISTIRDDVPDELAWRDVRFMVFDLPAHGGAFSERKRDLQQVVAVSDCPWLQLVPHWRVADHAELLAQLDRLNAAGAEGLMLQRDDALYHAYRSDDLLKVKRFDDDEARVVGHVPGRGKFEGMLGALEVQRADGLQFRIGTGFSDEERRQPPPVGTWVTYRYHGTTRTGVPKFVSFLRVRED